MVPADLPLLVLLPGMDGTGRFYDNLQRALDGRADSLIVTYPRQGPQTYRALCEALLPRLPTDRNYVLVAESFAGPLAVMLAGRAAKTPLGLCVAATFTRNPFPLFGGLLGSVLPMFKSLAPSPALIEAALLRPGDHAMAIQVAQTATAMGPALIQARCRSALTCNVETELTALDMPILCLQGLRDKLISPACGLLMKKIARNLRLVRVDAPHFVLQYDCDTTVRDILIPFLHDLV